MKKKGQVFIAILGVILTFILIIGISIFLVNLGFKQECKQTAEIMGVEWKYNFWIPCMVKIDGKFIPIDSYKVVGVKE
jgi:hypothetical protein